MPNCVNLGAHALWYGDCLETLRGMADNSVDAVVTDPPYGLNFLGKKWDYDVPATGIWAECLRVLKPGGHLLAFAGTRTQHRMAGAIEDAGFEIRDMIAWVYGSGFPKSLDVSKAIDKAAGADRGVIATATDRRDDGTVYGVGHSGNLTSNTPITSAAAAWQGWGTALKPALEPITVARKPLVGTVAANVLAHGTGALNVDGCRVVTDDKLGGGMVSMGRPKVSEGWDRPWMHDPVITERKKTEAAQKVAAAEALGRWPANLIHDGSDEVLAGFPDSGGAGPSLPRVKITGYGDGAVGTGKSEYFGGDRIPFNAGTGSAARFFYCAKANKKDRNEGTEALPQRAAGMVSNTSGQHITRRDEGYEPKPQGNHHPTVKPTDLMRYLCRLVTPPGGIVLDPFMGSGSTGKAAVREGFRFIGIEREGEYFKIAAHRIHAAMEESK